MELTIKERFTILGVLPREGNFLTLRIIRDLQKDLSFTEAEIEEFEIKSVDSEHVVWNLAKEKPVDIKIGEKAKSIIAEQFENMNKSKQLTIDHIDLYAKFVGEE